MKDDINEKIERESQKRELVLRDLTKQLEKMNTYLDENEKRVIETLRRKVTKWGNSAHIPIPSRFQDYDAIVKILKTKQEEEKTNL